MKTYNLIISLCDITGLQVSLGVSGGGWVYRVSNGRFFAKRAQLIDYLLTKTN